MPRQTLDAPALTVPPVRTSRKSYAFAPGLAARMNHFTVSLACATQGHAVQWIADFCLFKEQTDDLIAAGKCIEKEQARVGRKGDCEVAALYKVELCRLHLAAGSRAGRLQECIDDPDFSGTIVRDDGSS